MPPGAPILTAAAMRDLEDSAFEAGTSQQALMERASTAVAHQTARFALGRPILVLAGPGNNGGDAYGAAALLRDWGHEVTVAALGTPKSGAAAAMAQRWGGATVALSQAASRPVVVDGLFGIGLDRDLDADTATALCWLVAAADVALAIDLPSGLDTDSGALRGAADGYTLTLALGALKPAHVLHPASTRCGTVLLDTLGLEAQGDWRSVARPSLAAPASDAHKYSRGMVAVIAGEMPGAARLAASGALHGGAGYVVLCGASGGADAIVHRAHGDLDALLEDQRVGAIVIGPGLGRDDAARARLDRVLASDRALVIDGDALSLLGRDLPSAVAARRAASVLTPHAAEFDRCFGASAASKIERTLSAARQSRATIVHKGAGTVIATPDGKILVAADLTSWLSTAGTGDVLAGLIAARIATGGSADEAVWLHGRAASLAGPAFAADTLADHLSEAIASCR
nr:NAD(P)H-hydrate epimerase [Sphingomonas japonica]